LQISLFTLQIKLLVMLSEPPQQIAHTLPSMNNSNCPCPYCGSKNTKYNALKVYWRCLDDSCEKTFEGVPPADTESDNRPQKIFLSYGHDENSELVTALKERLERPPFSHEVWIDQEQIKFTQDWRQRITQGILESHRVLSFLSRHSVRDPGVCLDEIGIALSTRHGAIATLLVEPEEDVAIPASVSHIQYLNLSQWKQARANGDVAWNRWLDEQVAVIGNVIAGNSGFAGDMDDLQKALTPIPQWSRLGAYVDRAFIGRQWLFDELETWRLKPLEQRLFFITGGPAILRT
jgi:hypothetical protein